MARQIINKESKIIQWFNNHDYNIEIWTFCGVCTSTMSINITIPDLTWNRIKFRTKRKVGKLVYRVKNLFLALVGYRLLDAELSNDVKVFLHVENISDTTTKALVPRKGNKPGWAIRLSVDENDRMIVENDEPIYYKQYGEMSWM